MQKLARFLACSGVVATVALSAPGTAMAASPDGGSPAPHGWGVHPNWTGYDRNLISQGLIKLGPGNVIKYDPGPSRQCVRFLDSHSLMPLSERMCPTNAVTLAAEPGESFYLEGDGKLNDPANSQSWIYF